MAKRIIWSPAAEEDLELITSYLFKNWNDKVVNSFLDKLENSILLLSQFPLMFPCINREYGIHKCVVTKHNTLFYRLKKDHVELLRLFDTRQDPDKLKFT